MQAVAAGRETDVGEQAVECVAAALQVADEVVHGIDSATLLALLN
jgi:hypothetical protein